MGDAVTQLTICPLRDIPLVQAGDNLAEIIERAVDASSLPLLDGDVLVVAQKVVSKAEGQLIDLADVKPSEAAVKLAVLTRKDPRIVELILRESSAVVRAVPGVIIVRHRLGIVSANAGIDQSNIDHGEAECVLLLPEDPDSSAQQLREGLQQHTGKRLGVIISDSVNRPWRLGSVGIAIGSAGVTVVDDRRGTSDLYGRELKITMSNRADSIATAALMVMGETNESIPAAIVRGFAPDDSGQAARECIRSPEDDLFL